MLLFNWQPVFVVYRFGWTCRDARVAIDAFTRMDHQEIWTFIKAVDRADGNAIGELALDTVVGNDVCHLHTGIKFDAYFQRPTDYSAARSAKGLMLYIE